MITGDSKAVADSVARRIGIDEVAADVLPADKAATVKQFQTGGKRITEHANARKASREISSPHAKTYRLDALRWMNVT
jgi:magnesium-transporting ATPase (P-type)